MSSTTRGFVRPPLPSLPPGHASTLLTTPLPTPSFPASSLSFSILARVEIDAPAAVVASVIRNTAEWGQWNTFIPRCDVLPAASPPANENVSRLLSVGNQMTFRVNMAGTPLTDLDAAAINKLMQSGNVIKHIEPLHEHARRGFRIVWQSSTTLHGLLRAERVQEVVWMPEGGCEYVTWEGFGGVMAWVVRMTSGKKLVQRFGDWGRDLKGRAEGMIRLGMGAETRPHVREGRFVWVMRDERGEFQVGLCK